MNPPHPKGVKAREESLLRPKEISRYRDTLGQIRAADNTAGRSATRQLERCQTEIDLRYLLTAPPNGQVWHMAFFMVSDRDWSAVFVDRPTQRASVAQGLFYGGSGCCAVAHTRPAFAKNAYGPVGISLIRGASRAGRLTQPSRRR